nr:EAL domain-containing protein [Acidobacteriota bacterium]
MHDTPTLLAAPAHLARGATAYLAPEIPSYLAQAAGACVTALILMSFHRHYRRQYLRQWGWSWWAFAAYLAGAGLALYLQGLVELRPEASGVALLGIVVSALSLTGGYWQIAWLLSGTYEVATGRELERRRLSWWLAALGALALVAVLGSIEMPSPARLLTRVGVRSFCAGLAFVAAGAGVLRKGSGPVEVGGGLGRRLIGSAFLLYAIEQLHYSAVIGASYRFAGRLYFDYVAALRPFDFFLQSMMGLGMVIWLLEEERGRAFRASEQIAHLEYHDSLTELANRNLFSDRLRLVMGRSNRGRSTVAVFLLDLDRFKAINESLGHRHGDELLKLVAERLRESLRQADTVARLGGDEFAIMVPALSGERDMIRLAEKILESMRRPFYLEGRDIVVTTSLGISRYPEDGSDPEELLKKADVAMYQAKEGGRDGYQLYTPAMDADSLDRLSLENDLRKALAQGELRLFFQPLLDSRTRRITAVEALVRWQHPSRGLMLPGHFLDIAETSGLSNPLDLWVLRSACREVRSWQEDGQKSLRVAVNLSARIFQRPDLVERVKDVLWETGLPSSCLELEITENLAMEDAEASLGVLRGLKELGVRISIDDFGTGYSSLSYLRSFPIDTLKIDASFVRVLSDDRHSSEIASAMIALAHSLD